MINEPKIVEITEIVTETPTIKLSNSIGILKHLENLIPVNF